MIDEDANEYSAIPEARHTFYCGLLTVNVTEKALKNLNENSVLGPDKLPTRILKKCAHVLAPVPNMLMLAILTCNEWPALSMKHWIVPLHKRKSVYQAGDYTSIHLTSQISKIAKQILA